MRGFAVYSGLKTVTISQNQDQFHAYPKWVVLKVFSKVEINLSTTSSTKNQHTETQAHIHTLVLLFKGIQGEDTLKHIKGAIKFYQNTKTCN